MNLLIFNNYQKKKTKVFHLSYIHIVLFHSHKRYVKPNIINFNKDFLLHFYQFSLSPDNLRIVTISTIPCPILTNIETTFISFLN